MTFKETVEIIELIDDLALWSRSEGRELQREIYGLDDDSETYNRAEKYAAEAREKLFNYIKDLKGYI